MLRLLLIAAQIGGGIWLYRYRFDETLTWLKIPLVDFPILQELPFSQLVPAAFGLSMAVLLFRFIRRPGVFESGFFWALVTLALALAGAPGHRPLLFAAAALILVLGILETFHFMAFRDELTGLPARRAMNEALLKLGSRYTLAMVDIDFFKKFNDRHGHDVGDQVLRMVAARLSAVRGGGRAFRYGGEEFALLFPGCSVEEALPTLEQLRQEVERSEFALRGRFRPRKKPVHPRAKKSAGKLRVTVSIGAAERGGALKEPGQVLKAADQALYRAKKRGRNQVCR
jgi:diguanylate cyclase (GGDEF)-like protein